MKEIETISDPLPPTMFITKASTNNRTMTKAINIFLYLFFIFYLSNSFFESSVHPACDLYSTIYILISA